MRISFNFDPTPLFLDNPPKSNSIRDYAKALGLETVFLVDEGTENRSTMWHTGEDFRPFDKDWKLEVNNCDPLTPVAAKAIAALSKQPTRFGAKLLPYQPVVLDIEHTQTYNSPLSDAASLRSQIQAWTARFDLYRSVLGWDAEFYAYFFRGYAYLQVLWGGQWTPELAEADRQMMRRLSGFNIGLYNWDLPAQNPGAWLAQFDQTDSYVTENYPFLSHNKWVTMTPVDQIYWPTPEDAALNNQPVPLAQWKKQIAHVAETPGWNILLWVPPALDLPAVKGHLDALGKHL